MTRGSTPHARFPAEPGRTVHHILSDGLIDGLLISTVAVGSWVLPAAAFAGALLAIALVFRVATAVDRSLDVRVLLLAGVVVGAFFGAVIAFVLSLSDAPTVRGAVLWMMGSLGGADWRSGCRRRSIARCWRWCRWPNGRATRATEPHGDGSLTGEPVMEPSSPRRPPLALGLADAAVPGP